jgi:hypothetical protein
VDERQSQIKEGAGLDESRLNADFVDFLKKWSTPALLVIAAIVVGLFALRKLEERREAHIDAAFAQYEAAASPQPTGDPGTAQLTSWVAVSPFTLQGVAEEYSDVRGARWLSRLAAADTYLTAVRAGVTLGATVKVDGTVDDPEQDLLTPEARDDYLEQARSLYRSVLQDTENDTGATLHTLRALFGIAAVQESAGEISGARETLDRAATLAAARGYADLARLAERRSQTLDQLAEPVTLISQDALPKLPWEQEEPAPLELDEPAPLGPLGPPEAPGEPEVPGGEAPEPQQPAAPPGAGDPGAGEPGGGEPQGEPGAGGGG